MYLVVYKCSNMQLFYETKQYVTHLYKTSHMSQKHKLSFSYVLKEEKMGFNMVQKIFICDNYLQSYARLNALNTENVNSRNSGSKFSLKN